MNALTPTTSSAPLLPRDMNSAMQLATLMSQGKLVPAHLQRSPGDCLMVIEQAMRWGMSPFAVAQCTSVIQGKLMFEGKLVSAALHSSGILASRLDYEFSGAGDARAVTVRGTLRGEDKPREVVVTLKEAKTSNQMWTKQPDQQLVYFGTRAWARRHAPEVMLGVYSPEEFDAPAVAAPAFDGPTIEAKVEMPTMAEQIGDELPAHSAAPPQKRTLNDVINELEQEFSAASDRDAVDAVLASDKCQKALDYARSGAKAKLDGIIKAAMDRTPPPIDNAPENATQDDIFPGDLPSKVA